MKTGIEIIARERDCQLKKWPPRHDDTHEGGELAEAALACLQSYINGPGFYHPTPGNDDWGLGRKHNGNPGRLLTIAGALIAAELDRLDRLAKTVGN